MLTKEQCISGLMILSAVFLVANAATGPASAQAQTGGEFTIGVGGAPVQTLFEFFTDITLTTLSFGTIKASTETEGPALFAQYAKPMNERTLLVAHLNYTSYEKEYRIVGTDALAGAVSDDFYTLMMGIDHRYAQSDAFALYLGVMAGVSMMRSTSTIDEVETDDNILFAFQLTPLGMRIGNGFAVDLALGLGYKGIVSAGAGIRF